MNENNFETEDEEFFDCSEDVITDHIEIVQQVPKKPKKGPTKVTLKKRKKSKFRRRLKSIKRALSTAAVFVIARIFD